MHPHKCKPGDIVLHRGQKMSVSEVLVKGTIDREWKNNKGHVATCKGKKAVISVCRIMENGQILTRSPKYIGGNWEHVEND